MTVTERLCQNLCDLDSTQWEFLAQYALKWLSQQSIQPEYYAVSGVSLNRGPSIDVFHHACLSHEHDATTTNDVRIRWMLPYQTTDDPVSSMTSAIRDTHEHPFPRCRKEAIDLMACATLPDSGVQNATRFVRYRITQMLLRLALSVRNLGQYRLDSPDYALLSY